MMKKRMIAMLTGMGLAWTFGSEALAVKLVPDSTIAEQKKLTEIFKLPNGIPVVYREVPGSDIVSLQYSFAYGLKDQPEAEKGLVGVMFDVMTAAAEGWPKRKIFEMTEEYAAGIDCSGGIELSSCSLSTINDYWDKLLPMFAAMIEKPTFPAEDVKLSVARKQAEIGKSIENPDAYVNDVVNRVFYPKDHPYWLSLEDNLKQLDKASTDSLKALHQKVANAKLHQIVVVGSLPVKKVKADLAKYFGKLKATTATPVEVKPPAFDKGQVYAFDDRNIPTAYLRIKMNAPGIQDADAIPAKLMFKILDEELSDEIRTRRSLSYAVYSYVLDYKIGIGMMSATTSKPQETLEAMQTVIDKLKTHTYSAEQLEEYKTVYATSYYLTQEEHSSLASALSTYFYYHGSVDPLYEMPRKLGAVTAEEIKRAANKYLVNFRIGVVFAKDKFKQEWAQKLVKQNLDNT